MNSLDDLGLRGGDPLTTFLLIALAVAWVAVIGPAVVKARRATLLERSGLQSVPSRSSGGRPAVSSRSSGDQADLVVASLAWNARGSKSYRRAQRRRRRIFVALLWTVPLSLAFALSIGSTWWQVHLACDLSLALYTFLLIDARGRRREHLTKLRPVGQARELDPFRRPSAHAGAIHAPATQGTRG